MVMWIGWCLVVMMVRSVGITLGLMYPFLAEVDSRARVWSVPCGD